MFISSPNRNENTSKKIFLNKKDPTRIDIAPMYFHT